MSDGKTIGETQVTTASASANGPQTPHEESRGADLGRRRLIRGAAGIAPVVLTLRSGALAASSCVGAIATGASTGPHDPTSPNPTNSAPFSPVPSGAAVVSPAQQCIANANTADCPPSHIHGTLAPGGGGTPIGDVITINLKAGGTTLGCSGTPNSAINQTNIAILSSTAATSWLNGN